MILVVKIFKKQRRTWPGIMQPSLPSDWRTHRTSPKAELASVGIYSDLTSRCFFFFYSRIDIRTPPTHTHTSFSRSVLVSPAGGSSFIFPYLFWHWGFWSVPSILCTTSLGWFIWRHHPPTFDHDYILLGAIPAASGSAPSLVSVWY